MNPRLTLIASVLAAAIAAGCYTGGDTVQITAGSTAPGASAGGTQVASASVSGLPCDVATVLATSCSSCHGAVPSGGAPNTMMTYEDLVAPSISDPSRSVAELAVARMQDATRPMPPSGGSPTDAAVLAAWLAGGATHGSCETPASGGSYATAPVCTSNRTWTRGNHGSTSMRPGAACIQCHDSGEGPSYSVAGTIYPTAHEPDDCYGASGSQVVITDAAGNVFTATANSAGNFYLSGRSGAIQPPYTAKVVSGSKTRVMVGAQTDGDCNGCHSEQGTQKAPGRIMAP